MNTTSRTAALADFKNRLQSMPFGELEAIARDTLIRLFRSWGELWNCYQEEADCLAKEFRYRSISCLWDLLVAEARAVRDAETGAVKPMPWETGGGKQDAQSAGG